MGTDDLVSGAQAASEAAGTYQGTWTLRQVSPTGQETVLESSGVITLSAGIPAGEDDKGNAIPANPNAAVVLFHADNAELALDNEEKANVCKRQDGYAFFQAIANKTKVGCAFCGKIGLDGDCGTEFSREYHKPLGKGKFDVYQYYYKFRSN